MGAKHTELLRSSDEVYVEEVSGWLKSAGIEFRLGKAGASYDHSQLGNTDNRDVIVSVAACDFEQARDVLEKNCLEIELPEDHYLSSSSDEDLAEILVSPAEWSPFDVAHARRFFKARGGDIACLMEKRMERQSLLQQGKRADRKLIFFGWVIIFFGAVMGNLFGSVFGVLIGWNIASSKERLGEEVFFTYDEASRKTGRCIVAFGLFMFIFMAFFRGALLSSLS